MDACIGEYSGIVVLACDAITAILINCWPRVCNTSTTERIAEILSVCWLILHDEESRDVDRSSNSIFDLAKASLQQTAVGMESLLQSYGKGPGPNSLDAAARDSRLTGLFCVQATDSNTPLG